MKNNVVIKSHTEKEVFKWQLQVLLKILLFLVSVKLKNLQMQLKHLPQVKHQYREWR